MHRRFSQLHHAQGWALDSERFGHAAAILTGDLCLSFSEEAFTDIGAQAAAGTRARLIFNLMRAEVMAGQYLDILEEVAGPVRDRAGAVTRAQSIIRFKSAKYSTEHPLALGGALADAPDELLRATRPSRCRWARHSNCATTSWASLGPCHHWQAGR
ncbi:hypothetical protein AHiyo4_18860 [Arthrobacter sp. Hiyo4]|nr:hypothetical protein AHiyo4_18860 [Arthrobacter sp. Hiyo4]